MKLLDKIRIKLSGNDVFRKSLRKVLKIILNTIFFRRCIKIKLGGKYNVRLFINFIHYKNFGERHNSGWRKCLEYCRGKKNFFDVGAHIGLYSLPASIEMGTTGKVFAFEPGIKNYEILNRHIAINKIDNIHTENCIVGNKNANTLFYEDIRNTNPMNSLILYKNPELYEKTYRQQITLDTFCYKHNVVPDIIKIDVEGAELFVLGGAQEVLKQHQPTVFLSLHPSRMEMLGYSINDLTTFIDSIDYEIRDIDLFFPTELIFGEYILIPKQKSKPDNGRNHICPKLEAVREKSESDLKKQ